MTRPLIAEASTPKTRWYTLDSLRLFLCPEAFILYLAYL